MISFHAGDVPYIVCGGADLTHRRAVVTMVEGRALLGPTRFPEIRPELNAGERLVWRKASSGWEIWPKVSKP